MTGTAIRLNRNISAVRVPFTCGLFLIPTYVFIVEGREGILLIDTGGSGSGSFILSALEGMGYTAGDIRAIALSHWHNDHTGGLAELIDMIPADRMVPVYIGEDDLPHLQSGSWGILRVHPLLRIPLPHRPGRLPGGTGTRWEPLSMSRGRSHLVEGWSITPIHTPGHTPGHHAFHHAETDTMLAGCALAMLSRNTAGIVPVFTDRKMQIESAQRLAGMDFTWMYSIHFYLNTARITRETRISPVRRDTASRLIGSLPVFRYPGK